MKFCFQASIRQRKTRKSLKCHACAWCKGFDAAVRSRIGVLRIDQEIAASCVAKSLKPSGFPAILRLGSSDFLIDLKTEFYESIT